MHTPPLHVPTTTHERVPTSHTPMYALRGAPSTVHVPMAGQARCRAAKSRARPPGCCQRIEPCVRACELPSASAALSAVALADGLRQVEASRLVVAAVAPSAATRGALPIGRRGSWRFGDSLALPRGASRSLASRRTVRPTPRTRLCAAELKRNVSRDRNASRVSPSTRREPPPSLPTHAGRCVLARRRGRCTASSSAAAVPPRGPTHRVLGGRRAV